MPVKAFLFVVVASALAIGACQRFSGANPDNGPAPREVDPAVTSALNDQILVDPALTQQSNRNAVRRPETPLQAFYPVETKADEQARLDGTDGNGPGCVNGPFSHDAAWAKRLPPEFAPPPGARVTEAAASTRRGCNLRMVAFRTAEPAERVVDFYRRRAQGAGYSAAQARRDGDDVLAGSNPQNGTTYYLIVTPKSAGAEAALVINNAA